MKVSSRRGLVSKIYNTDTQDHIGKARRKVTQIFVYLIFYFILKTVVVPIDFFSLPRRNYSTRSMSAQKAQ